ncbi:Ig-like domain-containing protein, partial [Candidatus Margulisiibacteriota bacterium]
TVVNNTTYYYALVYGYRGGITSNYYSAGSNPVEPSNRPTTPNAIYPTDNLTAIPEQPGYAVSFYTTENIDHDPVQVDIYFGIEGQALTLVTSNMYTWAGAYTGFNVGTINRATTYNWKVVAKDGDHPGVETEGPTWSFTTQYAGEVDHFEDGLIAQDPNWWTYDALNRGISTGGAEGTYGMSVTGSAADWYIGGVGVTYWQDVSTYNYIALYVKNDNAARNSRMTLKLKEDDGDEWSYILALNWQDWTQVNVPLESFSHAGGTGDGVWSPNGGMGTVPQVKLELGYDSTTDFNNQIGFSIDKLRLSQSGSLADSQPQIISITPSGNAAFAPLGSTIRITFSEAMDESAVEAALGFSPEVNGTVTWIGNTMIFTPDGDLDPNTSYEVSLNASAATDLDGQTLTGTTSWEFNTSGGGAGYNPEVVNWSPRGTDAPVNPTVMLVFSEAMDRASVEAGFSFSGGAGTFNWIDDKTVAFTAGGALADNTVYTITVNSGVADADGDTLQAAFNWSFETGTAGGGTPPTVLAHSPVGNGIDAQPTVSVLFSEPMNQANVQSGFVISGNVNGVFAWTGNQMTFHPTSDLIAFGIYSVTVNAGVLDNEGDAMASADVWSFRIGETDIVPPNAVTDITPSQNGSTLVLIWSAPTDNTTATTDMRYNIYRSTTINFSSSANIVSLTNNTTVSVTNDAASSLNYYMIKAVDEAGNESPTSQVVFRLDKSMSYNNSPTSNINWISVPYNSPYTTARELADAINGGPAPGTVTKVHSFTNGQESLNLTYFFGSWVGDNFALTPGVAYAVIINAATDFTVVGMHDDTVNVSRTYNNSPTSNINWISLPYNAPYTTAQEVVNAINGGAAPGTVTKIHYFDNAQESRNLTYFFGSWIGDNFEVEPGTGYAVILNGDTTWKPSVLNPQ